MNEPITIQLPSGLQAPVMLPAFAVGYAVIPLELDIVAQAVQPELVQQQSEQALAAKLGVQLSDGPIAQTIDGRVLPSSGPAPEKGNSYRLIVALKQRTDATFYAAFHRARRTFPTLDWQELESVQNGASTRGAREGGYYDVIYDFDPTSSTFIMRVPQTDPMLAAYRGLADREAIEVPGTDNVDVGEMLARLGAGSAEAPTIVQE